MAWAMNMQMEDKTRSLEQTFAMLYMKLWQDLGQESYHIGFYGEGWTGGVTINIGLELTLDAQKKVHDVVLKHSTYCYLNSFRRRKTIHFLIQICSMSGQCKCKGIRNKYIYIYIYRVSCMDLWSTMEANDYDPDKRETKVVGIYWKFSCDYFYYPSI